MAPANPYDNTSYSILANADGSTQYVFATPNETLRFDGVDASKDADDKNVGVVQLLPAGQTENSIDGPVIRSTGDEHYTRLKTACLSRPGGQEDWDRLAIDNILSAGSSMTAANTPSLAAGAAAGAAAGNGGASASTEQAGASGAGAETAANTDSTDHDPIRGASAVASTSVPADAPPADHVSRVREILDELYHVRGLQVLVGELHLLVDRLHGERA
jgi:hypothetical protein